MALPLWGTNLGAFGRLSTLAAGAEVAGVEVVGVELVGVELAGVEVAGVEVVVAKGSPVDVGVRPAVDAAAAEPNDSASITPSTAIAQHKRTSVEIELRFMQSSLRQGDPGVWHCVSLAAFYLGAPVCGSPTQLHRTVIAGDSLAWANVTGITCRYPSRKGSYSGGGYHA